MNASRCADPFSVVTLVQTQYVEMFALLLYLVIFKRGQVLSSNNVVEVIAFFESHVQIRPCSYERVYL